MFALDSFGFAIAEFESFSLESLVWDPWLGICCLDSFGLAIAEFENCVLESLV